MVAVAEASEAVGLQETNQPVLDPLQRFFAASVILSIAEVAPIPSQTQWLPQ